MAQIDNLTETQAEELKSWLQLCQKENSDLKWNIYPMNEKIIAFLININTESTWCKSNRIGQNCDTKISFKIW